MRLSALLGLAALAGASACTPRVVAERGCVYDEDCAFAEECLSGECQATSVALPDAGRTGSGEDAGTISEDAGTMSQDAGTPSEPDAGPTCVADGLANNTSATAYPAMAADLPAIVEGGFCSDTSEFFRVRGWGGDPVQVIARWSSAEDRDVRLYETDLTQSDNIGETVGGYYELANGVLSGTVETDHVIELYAFGDTSESAVPYDVRIRTGFYCRRDNECVTETEGACRMPLWSPQRTHPTVSTIASTGMCSFGYDGCGPAQGDTLFERGTDTHNDERTTAKPLTGTQAAYGCLLDEDWWTVTTAGTERVSVSLTNTAETTGAFLLAAFDADGQMVGSGSEAQLPMGATLGMVVPAYAAGTLHVRVVQLNDDPLGTHDITVSSTAETCSGLNCTDADATRYGRTQCAAGACQCPVAGCLPQ